MSGEAPKEEPLAWARRVVAEKKTLFHATTHVVGEAERCYSGEGDDAFLDPAGNAVREPVVVIRPGHALLARPEVLFELEPAEVSYYHEASHRLAALLTAGVSVAADMGIPARTSIVLLTAALRAELAAFERQAVAAARAAVADTLPADDGKVD